MFKFYTIVLLLALGFFSKNPVTAHPVANATFLLFLALCFAGCLLQVVRRSFEDASTRLLG